MDGAPRNTEQRNWRFAAVLAYRFQYRHGVRATLLHAIASGVGQEFDLLSLAYSYTWGKGMPRAAVAPAGGGREDDGAASHALNAGSRSPFPVRVSIQARQRPYFSTR